MKDKISAHKQLQGEKMHDICWRFSQNLKKLPNHGLIVRYLRQAFYISFKYVTKRVVDAVCGEYFMRKPFSQIMQLVNKVSKNNNGWYPRDAEARDVGYSFELSSEQRKKEEGRDKNM